MISAPPGVNLFVGPVDPRFAWTARTATTALVAAFTVDRPVTVSQARFQVQAQAGNLDFGIYRGNSSPLIRLTSTGAFSCPAVGIATRALTASVTLVPGVRYWAAASSSTGSNAIYTVYPGVATSLVTGTLLDTASSAHPLPATLTLAGGTPTGSAPLVCFS